MNPLLNEAVPPIKDPTQVGRADGLPAPGVDADLLPGEKSFSEATLNAVILYDTLDFAAEARAMLKRAAQRAAPALIPFASRHGLRLILDEEHARTEDSPAIQTSAPEEGRN